MISTNVSTVSTLESKSLLTTRRNRRALASRLLSTVHRNRDLFDHSGDIVFTANLEGQVTSLNKTGEQIIGCSLPEALACNIKDLLSPRSIELARSMRDKKLREGGETAYEIEIVRKDGTQVILAVKSALTYCNGRPSGVRGIARDITEQKQIEERTRQSQKMEALGLLAGGIAHDFNNLLAVMVGYSEILSDRLKGDPSLHRYAAEVLKAGQQASALTGQLLAFSRRQVLQPKVLNVNSVIENMASLLQRLLRADIEVLFQPDPEVGQVKADKSQLQQVIMNLAVNARDAMPRGGQLRMETSNVDIEKAQPCNDTFLTPGRYVLLTISDTGVGMDAKTAASIFEPFFTTKSAGKGTGLGLATVYGIVKQSCGYISVRSQEGKGSSFMIYLPRVEESVTDVSSSAVPGVVPSGTEAILLVDDAEPFRKLVRMVLEGSGYTVLEASTSSEAAHLGSTYNGSIDMLLTDVVMPKVDGCQLSDYLRFHRADMKVMYMSGYAASATQAGLRVGSEVLQKPFSKDALLRAVRQTLDEHQESLASGTFHEFADWAPQDCHN
jgi:two-component system, cell cycle sensor histidine kinase and response regulator CckA